MRDWRFGPRAVDELECIASVLLAILTAHLIGATNISWAAFAGYMVLRGHMADTLARAVLRIVGTLVGGLLALVVVPAVEADWWLAALAILMVGTGSLYGAIVSRRAYAWLFFGLTFAMVLFDRIEQPGIALGHFVATRLLETLAGIFACVVVSLASAATLRRRWPAMRAAPIDTIRWHPDALRHAAQGGVALVILVILSAWLHVPALAQSAVTVMAVMLVPVSGIGPSGVRPVSVRIVQRFVGCVAGAALAAVFLFSANGFAPLLIFGSVLGVGIGRHLENGDHAYRYVGTQFTLAILITLVPDSYAHAAITPGLERLSGILIGMGVLEPVLLAWHLLSPTKAVAEASAKAQTSEL